MTRHFCDLCGESAYEPAVVGRYRGIKKWRGVITRHGDISCVEGEHQPYIDFEVGLHANDFEHVPQNSTPDLCAACIVCLLDDLRNKIIESKAASDRP